MRVLVVDDETPVRTGVRRSLETEGHHVTEAADGRAALSLVLEGDFDVIVLDVMLPGLNGYEVCRQIRARGVETPIIMLSAKSGEWDIADGLDLGADDYITKPFSSVELAARIRARGRDGTSGGGPYSNGILELVPDLGVCRVDGEPVELTAREVRLCRALFDRAGEAVPKRDLLASVWGAAFDGDANVVEVYVGRLRRKLGPIGARQIETVHGTGYRLLRTASR